MIDLLSEPRISLTDLAKREGVNCCTVWRWANRGVKSVRLETYSRGGRRFSTFPAFQRFCERVTAVTTGERIIAGQTPRQREAAINAAESALDEIGV